WPAWPAFGTWRSLVARSVRDAEVAGSNPAVPTRGGAVGSSCGPSACLDSGPHARVGPTGGVPPREEEGDDPMRRVAMVSAVVAIGATVVAAYALYQLLHFETCFSNDV